MGTAIIWDLDGVIVDSLGLRLAALRSAATEAGVEAPDERDLRRWLCHGPKFALNNIKGASTSLRVFEQFCRRVAPRYLTGFAGIGQTLESLDKAGVRQGLVTSRTAADTDRWLNLCRVPRLFQARITYSDRLRPKPDPESLLAVAERLQVAPGASAYIGDTIDDGTACERAGMAFLLAGWGTPDAHEVSASVSPAAVLENPVDVLSWVCGDQR